MRCSDASLVVWDPKGIVKSQECKTETEAKNLRENLEKAHGWDFRITKKFHSSADNNFVLHSDDPPQEVKIRILKRRLKVIEHELRVLGDRKKLLLHEIEWLQKGCC